MQNNINVLLYNKLWKGNIFEKIIYSLIPFILMIILYAILKYENAFVVEGGYGFMNDYTNKYILFFIVMFVYYISGAFINNMINEVKFVLKNQTIDKRYDISKRIINIATLLICFIGIFFIWYANKNGNKNWYSQLNGIELAYYSFLIMYVWYMSASLFLTIMHTSILLYNHINNDLNIDVFNIDACCGFKKLLNIIVANLGFGLYYLFMITVIVFSDINATKLGVNMAFSEDYFLLIVITVLLTISYYVIAIIPYLRLHKVLVRKISEQRNKYSRISEEDKFLKNINISLLSINNIFVFLLSILFPGVAAFIQIYSAIV